MKRVILWSVAIILMIAAIGLAAYPFISDYINSMNVEGQGVVYDESVENLSTDAYDQMLEDARQYNQFLVGNTEIKDPFEKVYRYPEDYLKMLSVDGTDIMATIQIPKINVSLPIYHGTSDEILKKGIGHLSSSSLPVGGDATHCILSGHTGSSGMRLFSDVDQLEIGDVFFITVLNEKLAYQVDNIEVVLPEETRNLQIDLDKDYVTLVTCTPFGINTHRLLVRGTRIDLNDGESIADSIGEGGSTWIEEYRKAIFWGAVLFVSILAIFFAIRFIVRSAKRKRNAEQTEITEKMSD